MRRNLTILTAAAALTFAACGGSSDSSSDGVASLDSVPAETSNDGTAVGDEEAPVDSAEADEPSPEDVDAAFEAYEKCLSDIGLGGLFGDDTDGVAVEVLDEAGADDGPLTDEQFQRMEDECEPLIADAVGGFELSPEQQAQQADAELAFARCMRDEGIDFPDPGSNGDGNVVSFEVGEDFDQDAMNAAFETCDSVFEDLGEPLDTEGA